MATGGRYLKSNQHPSYKAKNIFLHSRSKRNDMIIELILKPPFAVFRFEGRVLFGSTEDAIRKSHNDDTEKIQP